MNEPFDIVVIGAGISGLTFAHRVARQGRRVLVVEGSSHPGGCIRTERLDQGFWLELGAHTLYNSYGSLLEVMGNLDLQESLLTRRRAPFRLLVDGKVRSIPAQLSLSELFASAWHAFSERKRGRTVADYYGRLVGQKNYQRVFGPLFSAVPSQPADGFPAEMLFKRRKRRKDIPRSFTLRGGLQTLIEGMASTPGLTLRSGARVKALARVGDGFVAETDGAEAISAPKVALAVPPAEAARLLGTAAPALATELGRIQTASIDSVGIVAPSNTIRLPRLTCLIPLDDIFFSVVTRDVVPDENLRGLTFHFRVGLPVQEHLDRIAQVSGAAREQLIHVAAHATTLPALALGHAEITAAIDKHLPTSGLYITGNYFGGLALEDCSLRSKAEAERFQLESAR